MSLRLRVWAWALIVGFAAWVFLGLMAPTPFRPRLPLMADPWVVIHPAIFFGFPVILLTAALLLWIRPRKASEGNPFTFGEKAFYSIALILGVLPATLILLLIGFQVIFG